MSRESFEKVRITYSIAQVVKLADVGENGRYFRQKKAIP